MSSPCLKCYKVKSKWFAMAEVEGTCLADAHHKFDDAGYVSDFDMFNPTIKAKTDWKETFIKQKNFGGYHKDFKTL